MIGKTSFNKEHKEIVLYVCKFDYSNTQMSTQMELYFLVEVSSQQQRKHILLCQKTSFAWVGFPLIIIFSHPNQASRVLSERLNHQITNCFIENFLNTYQCKWIHSIINQKLDLSWNKLNKLGYQFKLEI